MNHRKTGQRIDWLRHRTAYVENFCTPLVCRGVVRGPRRAASGAVLRRGETAQGRSAGPRSFDGEHETPRCLCVPARPHRRTPLASPSSNATHPVLFFYTLPPAFDPQNGEHASAASPWTVAQYSLISTCFAGENLIIFFSPST